MKLEQISFACTTRKNLGATGDLFASARRSAWADELPVVSHFASTVSTVRYWSTQLQIALAGSTEKSCNVVPEVSRHDAHYRVTTLDSDRLG